MQGGGGGFWGDPLHGRPKQKGLLAQKEKRRDSAKNPRGEGGEEIPFH